MAVSETCRSIKTLLRNTDICQTGISPATIGDFHQICKLATSVGQKM